MSGDGPEHERLFNAGYQAGTRLLARWEDMTEEERSEQPIAVLFRIGGPSNDFIIGRIFEAAVEDAHDRVVKRSDTGLLMDTDQWRRGELAVRRAERVYRDANCALLR
jgi:hypothetical protein